MNKILLPVAMLFLIGCSGEESAITGKIVYDLENANRYIIELVDKQEEVEEEPDIVTMRHCADSDNGNIKWAKGVMRGFYSNATTYEFIDYCRNRNYLMEFHCFNDDPKQEVYFCRNGCVDGACL